MTKRHRFATLFGAVLVVACGTRDRGHFGALTLKQPGHVELISKDVVIGKACFESGGDDPVFQKAVDNALKQSPGAEMLVRVKVNDEGKCVYVAGFPARFVQSAITTE